MFNGKRLVRIALAVSPPFLVLILWLSVHRLGWIEHDWRITRESTLILCLLLFWALATLLVAAMTRRRSTSRYWARRMAGVALLAVSTVLCAGLAEVVLRILRPEATWQLFRTHPSKRFHHRNPADVYGIGWDGIRITTNEDGFRRSLGRGEFRRYADRIAVLGDSFAFGLGVSDEHVSTVVLEEALHNRLGDDVAVVNAGALSYSPLLERSLFREVVADYRPTLTLLLLDVGDVGDDYRYSHENIAVDPDEALFDVPDRASGPSLCDRLALCRVSRDYLDELGIPREFFDFMSPDPPGRRYDYYDFRVEVGGVTEDNHFFILRHPLEHTRSHFERTLGYIGDIAADAAAVGSELVLVVTPRFFHWNNDECPNNWEKNRYDVDEPYEHEYFRFFESVEQEVDFKILSLLPAFQASDTYPLVFDRDPHWNEAGHRLVGEALADYLVSAGLVRPPAGP